MLKIENEVLPSPKQMEAVIRGTRNPKNSWGRSDSVISYIPDEETMQTADHAFVVGPNDETLLKKLAAAGPVHGKFLRMMPIYVDITAPLYWWKEFDTYKVGTVANSCSTMHKIAEKEFTYTDFSCEHLIDAEGYKADDGTFVETDGPTVKDLQPYGILNCCIIPMLNKCRELYISTNDKTYWWQMIQLLPSSYNQKRTVMLNYEVLRNIYIYRHDHKLDEWHTFCDWIEKLPMSYLITEKTNAIPQPDQKEIVCIDTSTAKTKKDLTNALERYAKEEFDKGLKDLP